MISIPILLSREKINLNKGDWLFRKQRSEKMGYTWSCSRKMVKDLDAMY